MRADKQRLRTLKVNTNQVANSGETSDGYHTFSELYDHRIALFMALMKTNPQISWRANNHDDGTMFEGWYIAGMNLPTGDITYHLPGDTWTLLDGVGIATSNKAPKWDGHTAADVVNRLHAWVIDLKLKGSDTKSKGNSKSPSQGDTT